LLKRATPPFCAEHSSRIRPANEFHKAQLSIFLPKLKLPHDYRSVPRSCAVPSVFSKTTIHKNADEQATEKYYESLLNQPVPNTAALNLFFAQMPRAATSTSITPAPSTPKHFWIGSLNRRRRSFL
jgi:hypothetical protein